MESKPDLFIGTKCCVSCRSPIINGRISRGHVHKGSELVIASFCSVCGKLSAPRAFAFIKGCEHSMGCYGEWEEWMGTCEI